MSGRIFGIGLKSGKLGVKLLKINAAPVVTSYLLVALAYQSRGRHGSVTKLRELDPQMWSVLKLVKYPHTRADVHQHRPVLPETLSEPE